MQQGEAAPGRAAAATGCPARLPRRATLQRACRRLGRLLPRTCANLWREEKLGPERQLSTPIFEVGVQFSGLGCVARAPPGAPARAARALVGATPHLRFALDNLGEPYLQLRISKSGARGDPRDAVQGTEQPPGCPRDRPWQAAH